MTRPDRLLGVAALGLLLLAAPTAGSAQDAGATLPPAQDVPGAATGAAQQPVPPAAGAAGPAVRVAPSAPTAPPPGTAAANGQADGPATGSAPAPPGTAPSERAPPAFTSRGPDAAELELQRALRGGVIEGQVSIPDGTLAILVQPEGRDWRVFRNHRLTWIGLGLIALTVVALAALYLLRGPTRIAAGRAGRHIARYSMVERVNHWMVAASFILLALTGLNITFGAYALRPLIGAEAFTALTFWGQWAHHYLAFPFTLGLFVMQAVWLRDNLPTRTDLDWLKAGGPLARGHPPAGRFNAGQKGLFWATVGGGMVIAASGFLLMFPFAVTDVGGQQWAHIVHGLGAMLLVAAILGHIYLGTIGTEGALEQMTQGSADWNYLREHHSAWLEEEVARARDVAANDAPGNGRKAVGAG